MSVVFTMTAMAVAFSITGVTTLSSIIREEINCRDLGEIEPMETCFADGELLIRTLQEHGFYVEQGMNDIVVKTNVGSIRFFQKQIGGNFWALPFDLKSEEEMAMCTDEITEEYLLNVQKNNYLLLKEQLKQNKSMCLESETILEDNTILLTVQL